MLTVSLEGQVAVVTGGSRGIGAATVRLLAEAGACVAFNYHSRPQAAQSVLDACPDGPSRVVAMQDDASDPEAAGRLVALAVERFGRLDIAVANAGIWNADDLPIDQLTPREWDQTIDLNLRGVYALARAATLQMKRQPRHRDAVRGRIITIASTAGQRGEAWHTHYAASKGGVISFTRGLGTELARDGIRTNCVAPGWVDTEMSAAAMTAHPERIFDAIPLGRPGRPEEIAGCVLFLCTPWSDFLVGSVLSANGGAVMA